jgi:hypothetical protein
MNDIQDIKYLEENVRIILEPMINNVLSDNPKEPVKYMIDWLDKYLGLSNEYSLNVEKEELNLLRKEIKKFKTKYPDFEIKNEKK